jgi:hypothetical protein
MDTFPESNRWKDAHTIFMLNQKQLILSQYRECDLLVSMSTLPFTGSISQSNEYGKRETENYA